MIKLLTSAQTVITPELAATWLKESYFERQRPLKEAHRDFLAGEMKNGRFIAGAQQIHFAKLNGKNFLVNGQHTLSAIAMSEVPMTLVVSVTSVNYLNEVAELYCAHDVHAKRSGVDAIRAKDVNGDLGLTLGQTTKLCAAIRLIHAGFDKPVVKPTQAEVMSLAKGFKSEASAFFGTCADAGLFSRHVTVAPIMSVALITFRYAPDAAYPFWAQTMLDDGLRAKDPRKLLHTFILKNLRANAPRGIDGDPRYVSRMVANAWNMYHAGKMRVSLPKVEIDSPIVIAGSNYGVENVSLSD